MTDLYTPPEFYACPQAICKGCNKDLFYFNETWYHHHNHNMLCQMGLPFSKDMGVATPIDSSIWQPPDEDLPLEYSHEG